ncbi:hemerythrin domain-containing protein [Mycobacterium sp.]|uniref:hemerythrin domain-containing protein n=1 Tax=Mycobacterium sp. TaxID=1785 RepID=UPI002B9A625D|nr:hemerythrin domain-containing protein [Mycobacterium sp.]HTQ22656.1 hemerythrin domain-containing protein [Mycobacterium sp.]
MPADAFDMPIVHRALRNELRNAPGLVRDVGVGDTARSAVVGAHLEFILAALHNHHATEDELIWPKLHARAPDSAEDITRMEQAHRGIADADARVTSVLAPWITSADAGLARQLVEAAEELSARVDEHLADEERNIVPLINRHITGEEWQQCVARAAEFLSRKNLRLGLVLGGLVLDASSADEARRILASAPLPQRILLRSLARRTLARYQTNLYRSAG